MSDSNNILAQATIGANNPAQSTSTQKGFYEAPNALFKAMNQNTVTDLKILSQGSVGTFLQRRKLVNGDVATIINASLSYLKGGKTKHLPPLKPGVKTANTSRTFIPIIIKTDFNYNTTKYAISGTTQSLNVPTPLYIIFDSTPEEITFNKQANWESKSFLGRPEPVWTYQHSGSTTFTLVGKFYAESVRAHGRLLKLSDYIMSLVTPSKSRYMPSPITVFIGEWKELRCIVNTVAIKYSGPWTVKVDEFLKDSSSSVAGNDAMAAAVFANSEIPSHAPYLFEATFNLTVVGRDNEVKYAEDVISGGSNNNSDPIAEGAFQEAALQNLFNSAMPPEQKNTIRDIGPYSLTMNKTYTLDGGQIKSVVSQKLKYSDAGETLNVYENANAVNRLSDQGVISNALNSQMLKLFQKKNPTSTNTPATTSSLNPFKKLF
ncbi:MAG: hypothetical protein JHC33_10635 [Ignisphaera sp.]|nr:hypothetical protein [Ignisphaera sp.]